MKKLLISLLIVLLLVLNCIVILNGISIFGLDIWGINQIKEANQNLDIKIAEATTLASTDYPKLLSSMETNIKKLEEEKKNYEDMVTISTGEQVQLANQYQKYEVEYLWTIIGNHATKEGVVIKIDIVAASAENHYNLNFTVNGSYIGITEFISDIENDSALGFKIENFSMKPGSSTQELRATFTCNDIEIKDIAKNADVSDSNASTNGSVEKITQNSNTNVTDEDTDETVTSNGNTINSNTVNKNVTNTNTTGGNSIVNTNSNTTSDSAQADGMINNSNV